MPGSHGGAGSGMSRERLEDMDRAKGLAIFLVVLGHLTLRSRPAGNEWYLFLETLIYMFHMPFFMFISGFVMFYSFPRMATAEDYVLFIKKRFIRLIPAFFLFSVLITLGKVFLGSHLLVDNAPSTILQGIVGIMKAPMESDGKSLWYIYVLFLYQLIFAPLILLLRRRLYLLVLIGVLIGLCYILDVVLPATNVIAINSLKQYFLPFSVGIYLAAHREEYVRFIDRHRHIFLLVFLASFSILLFDLIPSENVQYRASKVIIGLLSVPALHSLMRSPFFRDSRILLTLGKYTFAIYLMNTIAIGLAKGITLRFVSWHGHNFLFIAPVLLLTGILGPIAMRKYVLAKVKVLNVITN
jgi:fucose 4-O-acetylase-like acetyltransferase